MLQPVHRSIQVQVFVPRETRKGAKVFLPDVPELRNTLLVGIEALDQRTVDLADDGSAVISPSSLKYFTLTLVSGTDRRCVNMPLASMNPGLMSGLYKEFNDWRVNYQKSYLTVVDPSAVRVTVPLNIIYKLPQ